MKYEILYYDKLDFSGLNKKFNKTVNQLSVGDFSSADVKKLKPAEIFRAKLNDTHRLLFKLAKIQNKTYILLLEVIKNHAYDKSRFLQGLKVKEASFHTNEINTESLLTSTLPKDQTPVHYLDKFIIFDIAQTEVFQQPLPLIIIGSAGSGKTSVTLEKLKHLSGDLLYVSLSAYLVQNSRRLYYANHYVNEHQQIDFLSFRELLEMIKIPMGKEIDSTTFIQWANKQVKPKILQDTRKLFEEFRGVLTGGYPDKSYLAEEEYIALGIKQSIYPKEERHLVYSIFLKYLQFLKKESYYDSNILSHTYQEQVQSRYDTIIIDEVQDFTNSQVEFVLRHLTDRTRFILSGDANQIVHPNFFSWSKLKSYFYQDNALQRKTIIQILAKNYRNTLEVTELANRILKLKKARFGSIDKESHYLVRSTAKHHGVAECVEATTQALKIFDEKIARSAKSAVLVLTDEQKTIAKQYFKTPLIFTVQEAKGLEYDNIILYNFISHNKHYDVIGKGIDPGYMEQEHKYARDKDKSNKEIEVYKFYINALYVAITRAINNVYLLEHAPKSRLLKLLKIDEIKDPQLNITASSKDEWQQEASRLAKQGKTEQADAIEANILKHKPVPWDVLTQEKVSSLLDQLNTNPSSIGKDTKIKLLNYAVLYQRDDIITYLRQLKFKTAFNLKRVNQHMTNNFFMAYYFNNDKQIHQEIDRYGLEFRNPFNWTPLMCAAYMGNKKHVLTLCGLGSSASTRDNENRTPMVIALSKCWYDAKYREKVLPEIYPRLSTESLQLRYNDQLIVIDASKSEYFLLVALLSLQKKLIQISPYRLKYAIFDAVTLAKLFAQFSDGFLPIYRTRNTYISSVLSRNEINSKYKTNRRLFMRVKHGVYRVNPRLKIRVNDNWMFLLGSAESTVNVL